MDTKSNLKATLYLGGSFCDGNAAQEAVISPWNGEQIGVVTYADSSQIDQGLKQAQQGFEKWGALPLKERTQVMFRFREELLSKIDDLSEVVSLENGKTKNEARAGIMKGIEVLEFALSLQNLDSGAAMEVSRGVSCEYRREPLGVVVGITPFNFPAMVPMWMIPIALTLGNAFVWKPSEKTPLTSFFIAEALKKSGLPDGALTLIQGGKEQVETLVSHPLVKAIGFVGSSKIAKLVYAKGAQEGKRVLALGGAKNHLFLLPDAHPELTAKAICDSFTGCAGQRCMAASVLLAVGPVDHFIEQIKKECEKLVLGETMGAIITPEQKEFLFHSLEKAQKEGAKILLDGRKASVSDNFKGGNWLGPTLLDNVQANSFAACDELFGPILSIVRCQNLEEALAVERQNPYGNAAGVFTQSGSLARKVVGQARAGMCGVNIGVPVPREPFSFAGIGDSKFGHGEITGEGSLSFWSDLKKITTKWEPQNDHNWMS